jgi:hypothetical protein
MEISDGIGLLALRSPLTTLPGKLYFALSIDKSSFSLTRSTRGHPFIFLSRLQFLYPLRLRLRLHFLLVFPIFYEQFV